MGLSVFHRFKFFSTYLRLFFALFCLKVHFLQSIKYVYTFFFQLPFTIITLLNNYSPKAKLILLNNPRDEVEGIIQQY